MLELPDDVEDANRRPIGCIDVARGRIEVRESAGVRERRARAELAAGRSLAKFVGGGAERGI